MRPRRRKAAGWRSQTGAAKPSDVFPRAVREATWGAARGGGRGGPTGWSQGRGAKMGGGAGEQVSRGPGIGVLGPPGYPGRVPLRAAASLYWVPWPPLGYTRAHPAAPAESPFPAINRPSLEVTQRLNAHTHTPRLSRIASP